jgi:ComF family protein
MGPCGRCRRQLSPFAQGASLGPFEGPLRSLLHALKYEGRRRAARQLGEALAGEPGVRRLLAADARLLPVPLHPARRRARGFNQAELLARALARHAAGCDVVTGVLARHRDTPSQTGLGAAQRRRNVRGAFAVRRPSLVAGRRLVLVDDVFTTGATARECARALHAADAREVCLITAARVQ